MTTSSTPGSTAASQDLQAVLAARRELGPDYDRALVDSFVERAEAQLVARFPRPAAASAVPPVASVSARPATAEVGAGGLALAAATLVWGLLSTLLAVAASSGRDPVLGVPIVAGWVALGLADLVYAVLAFGRRGRHPD